MRGPEKRQITEGSTKELKGAGADASHTSRLTRSSLALPSAQAEDPMAQVFLSPLWGLLKLELHRLVSGPRRWRRSPGFTRFR